MSDKIAFILYHPNCLFFNRCLLACMNMSENMYVVIIKCAKYSSEILSEQQKETDDICFNRKPDIRSEKLQNITLVPTQILFITPNKYICDTSFLIATNYLLPYFFLQGFRKTSYIFSPEKTGSPTWLITI